MPANGRWGLIRSLKVTSMSFSRLLFDVTTRSINCHRQHTNWWQKVKANDKICCSCCGGSEVCCVVQSSWKSYGTQWRIGGEVKGKLTNWVGSQYSSGAKGVGRPRGCAPCWQEHTNKTRVKPDIPAKSYTCMSTSWLLGNVYTAKSCKGEKRVPDALKSGLVS